MSIWRKRRNGISGSVLLCLSVALATLCLQSGAQSGKGGGKVFLKDNVPPGIVKACESVSFEMAAEWSPQSGQGPHPAVEELLIEALGDEGESVDLGQIVMKKADYAEARLLTLGPRSLPRLIAATEHPNWRVRERAITVLSSVCLRNGFGVKCLPVLERARWDVNVRVELAGTAALGGLAAQMKRGLDATTQSLVGAMESKSPGVSESAIKALIHLGRRDLVGEERAKSVGRWD